MQGKDRLWVKHVGEQLQLEGSYTPRTYIEQIQLEKLVDEVMVGQPPKFVMLYPNSYIGSPDLITFYRHYQMI